MAKRKRLNGLPHNLVRSYFSTLRYHMHGYMADWLMNAAHRLNVPEATLDILNERLEPPALNLYPLLIHLKELKPIIEHNLAVHGFTADFVSAATIRVEFPPAATHSQTIYCYASIVDKNGRSYESGRIVEPAHNISFDPFNLSNMYPAKTDSFFGMVKRALGLN